MRAADILKRLERARRLIATFPASTEILSVLIDGTGHYPDDLSSIHLAGGEWDKLMAADVIAGYKPILPHSEEYDKLSIMTGGFELFELVEKKSAAPGVTSTEGGMRAADAQSNDTLIIEA